MAMFCDYIFILFIFLGFDDGLGFVTKEYPSSFIERKIDIWVAKNLLLDYSWQFYNETGMDYYNLTKVGSIFGQQQSRLFSYRVDRDLSSRDMEFIACIEIAHSPNHQANKERHPQRQSPLTIEETGHSLALSKPADKDVEIF